MNVPKNNTQEIHVALNDSLTDLRMQSGDASTDKGVEFVKQNKKQHVDVEFVCETHMDPDHLCLFRSDQSRIIKVIFLNCVLKLVNFVYFELKWFMLSKIHFHFIITEFNY